MHGSAGLGSYGLVRCGRAGYVMGWQLRLGSVRRAKVRLVRVWLGKSVQARLGGVRTGVVRSGKAVQGSQGEARQSGFPHGEARHGAVRRELATKIKIRR